MFNTSTIENAIIDSFKGLEIYDLINIMESLDESLSEANATIEKLDEIVKEQSKQIQNLEYTIKQLQEK